MKIYSSKLDEARARQAEYDAKYAEYEESSKAAGRGYANALHAVTDPVAEDILSKLHNSNTDMLNLKVDVDVWWDDGVRVTIDCNSGFRAERFGWTYRVEYSEGEVKFDCSSSSFRSQISDDDIEVLRQSAYALKILNGIDWKTVLDNVVISAPKRSDFQSEINKPEFYDRSADIRQAAIEDMIGDPRFFKVSNWENSPYYGRYVWCRILSETPSQYRVNILPQSTKDTLASIESPSDIDETTFNYYKYKANDQTRVRKSSIWPVWLNGNEGELETVSIPLFDMK